MKKITYFHLNSCPYCKNANKAIEELRAENPEYNNIEIDMIEENEHPEIIEVLTQKIRAHYNIGAEIIEKYDYHAVPCMWIGDQKIYEAHLFEKYDECKEQVRKVFEAAK